MNRPQRGLALALAGVAGASLLLMQRAAEQWYSATVERLTAGSRLAGISRGRWSMRSSARARPQLFLPAEVANDPDRLAVAITLADTTFPLDMRREGTLNDARLVTTLPELPLHTLRVPTLILHGTKDANVPHAQSIAAAAAIPNAQFVSVEGGDHATTLFLPQATDALREFIQSHVGLRPSP